MKKKYLLFIPTLKPLSEYFMNYILTYERIEEFDIHVCECKGWKTMYEHFDALSISYEIAIMHHSDWFFQSDALLQLIHGIEDGAEVVGTHCLIRNEEGSLRMKMYLDNRDILAFCHLYAVNPNTVRLRLNWDGSIGDLIIPMQQKKKKKFIRLRGWEFHDITH